MPPPTRRRNDRQPHPGLSTPAEATALEQTITTTHQTNRKTNDQNTFSELNSIRPLGMGIQDLRPLRGRPPADPGPPRLAGVYPYRVGENQKTSTRKNQHY
jgi:hypothetical protein